MWKPIVWKRAARVFSLVLIVMFVVAFWGVVTVARNLGPLTSGSTDYSILGIQLFVGSKNGSISTLQPQLGAALVFVVPVLAAALTVALSVFSTRGRGAGREPMPHES
jgi:hypothetical protein